MTAVVTAVVGGLLLRGWRSRVSPLRPVRGVVLVLASGFGAGGDAERTPALARLAASGRRFERAFAPEPDPRATRAAVLAGLPEAFRARAAAVAAVGLTAPGDGEDGSTSGERPAFGDRPTWDLVLPGALADSGVGARLEQWLRAQAGGRFLLVAGVGGDPAASLEGVRPASDPIHGTSVIPRMASGDLGFGGRPGGVVQPPAWSEDVRRRAETAYLERSRAADEELERLLSILARAAPDGDVAIVVLGDPPPDLGAHGVLTRGDALFETTLRVGLVAVAPATPDPGRATRGLASSLDIGPTLLDLAGPPPGAGRARGLLGPRSGGKSLVPLLTDPEGTVRSEALSSVTRRAGRIGRSVRTARYRYTEWPDGSEELYDHTSDPGENVNLASRPEHRATIRALQKAFEPRAGPAAAAAQATPAPARPRNVLLIVVDDLNTRVGAWGAPVLTPNLDRLAKRGVRFDHAYVQVSMCSPSRTSFLTGWGPERTGVWDNMDPARPAGAAPLQEQFGARGYFTASVGKIYHYPERFRWDWRDAASGAVEETPDTGAHPTGKVADEPWVKAAGGDADQPDGMRARKAVELLQQRHHGRPFFLAVGFGRPHRRWIAPTRYFALYPPETITFVPAPEDDLADVPAIAIKTKPQPLPGLSLKGREPAGLVPDPSFRRKAIAAYQACVSFMDAQLGLLLDALERQDMWKDTVVVLVGDNGYHLGEHGGLYRKDTLFEEGLRVPFIVAAPGLAHPGSAVAAPVALLDLYSTVTDLAGLPAVPGLDGRSLRPLAADPEAPGWDVAVSYRRVRPPERGWSLRTDGARYTLWPDGSEELYDHETDPGERENLAGRADVAGLKARLHARLVELVAGRAPATAE
jgi:uncharacterized sulfatase